MVAKVKKWVMWIVALLGVLLLAIFVAFSGPTFHVIMDDGEQTRQKLKEGYHKIADHLGEDWREE